MTELELKKQYAALIKDLEFDHLEIEAKKPNLFEILGAVNNELRHSNILAWLLNPDESHGLGESFLKRFLREIAIDDKANLEQYEIESLDFSDVEVRREWNKIDILVLFPNTVIAVENKIWSKETGDQLTRYKSIVDERFGDLDKQVFVYLTPFGEVSVYENDVYVQMSYSSIVEILERILLIHNDSISVRTKTLLDDYLITLKRYIMEDDRTIELAQSLYMNHKQLFDFVYEHKPDLAEDLRKYFIEKIDAEGWFVGSKNKGYVRFQTQTMKDLLPSFKEQGGWPDNEPFLFELDFWWNSKRDNSDTRIYFKAVISPGDNEPLITLLKEIMDGLPDTKPASGAKWFTYFPKKQKYNWEKVEGDLEKIKEPIDKIWPFVKETVSKVDEALLAHSDRIKNTLN